MKKKGFCDYEGDCRRCSPAQVCHHREGCGVHESAYYRRSQAQEWLPKGKSPCYVGDSVASRCVAVLWHRLLLASWLLKCLIGQLSELYSRRRSNVRQHTRGGAISGAYSARLSCYFVILVLAVLVQCSNGAPSSSVDCASSGVEFHGLHGSQLDGCAPSADSECELSLAEECGWCGSTFPEALGVVVCETCGTRGCSLSYLITLRIYHI